MNEEMYSQIERYVAGEMDISEKLAFEQQLNDNPVLADKVQLYQSVQRTLRTKFNNEEKEKQFEQNINLLADAHFSSQKDNQVNVNWYKWAVAASVLLVCGILFYTSQSSKPEYNTYAVFEPIALVERGSSDSIKAQAQSNFNSGKYDEALVFFNILLRQEPDNTEVKVYKAIVLIELNEHKEAEELLNTIRESSSIYKHRSIWFLVLSALKQKEYERCKSLLKEIPQGADDYIKAQQLLDEL